MIRSINIKNFRGLQEASLGDLSGRLFVTGMNRAGKTPLLNAVQFAFSGVVYGQDDKRMQLAELVGPWGREACIEVGMEIDGEPLVLEVTVQPKRQQCRVMRENGGEVIVGTPDEVRTALWKRMGKDFARVHAGIHPRAYLLSREILQHVAKLSGGIDAEQLVALCGIHWEWLESFAAARRLKLDSPEALAKLGDAAYAARTEANRSAKRIATQLEGDGLLAGQEREFMPEDLPDLRANLAELRNERDTLQRQLGAATGVHTQEEIDAGIVEAEAALAALKAPPVSSANLKEKREEISKIHSEEKLHAGKLFERKEVLEKQIAAIKGSQCCPTCKRAYKGKDIEKLLAPLEEDLAKVSAQYAEKVPYVKSLLDSLPPLDERIHDARSEEDGYNAEKRRIEARLEAFRACAPRVDTSDIQGDIAVLDGRIAKGEAIIQEIVAHQQSEEKRRELDRLYAEIEHLNWAVAAFQNGDVTNQLTGDARDTFVAEVNACLARFNQQIAIVGEQGYLNIFLINDGKRIPISSAGDSELLIVQLAVAEAFGQGLVVLDRLEQLDGDRKATFFEALGELESDFVLAGVWGLGGAEELEEQICGLAEYIAPVDVAVVSAGVARSVAAAEVA